MKHIWMPLSLPGVLTFASFLSAAWAQSPDPLEPLPEKQNYKNEPRGALFSVIPDPQSV
jgi:hypothetical protein